MLATHGFGSQHFLTLALLLLACQHGVMGTIGNEDSQFKKRGKRALSPQKSPLSVRVEPHIDAFIRAKPDRSEWLRRVVTEAAIAEMIAETQGETCEEDG